MKTGKMGLKKGLTLIEVILAALLLSMGVSVLLVAASRCLAVIKRAKFYQSAQWTLAAGEADHPIEEEAEDPEDAWSVGETEYPEGFRFARSVLQVELAARREEAVGTGPCLVALYSRAWPGEAERALQEEWVKLVFRKECPWK